MGEWLREVQAHNVKLREHEHTPLYELMRWAGRSGQALFDSIVVFENYPVSEALQGRENELRFGDVRHVDTTTYAMTLSASVEEALDVTFEFARAQFDEGFVERLSEHFGRVLEQVVQGPERRLGEIDLLTQSSAPPSAGPRRKLRCVDGRLGDVHPLGGQRVELQQPAPGPRARRDDGGGNRKDRAFPRPDVVGAVVGGRWPSGMCTSTTRRSRRACGTSTSGAVEATSPSSSTTASSGICPRTPARAASDAASGRGQQPGTACSCTDQPSDASPRQTRRS